VAGGSIGTGGVTAGGVSPIGGSAGSGGVVGNGCATVTVAATGAYSIAFKSPAWTLVTVAATGAYSVAFKSPAWTFSGNLGASASAVTTQNSSDKLGSYCETTFTYNATCSKVVIQALTVSTW
jgi:hypothetical protein